MGLQNIVSATQAPTQNDWQCPKALSKQFLWKPVTGDHLHVDVRPTSETSCVLYISTTMGSVQTMRTSVTVTVTGHLEAGTEPTF